MQSPGPQSIWYIGRDGQQYGPMSTEQLQGEYRAGVLLPTDYLWCAEIDRWISAADVFGQRPPPPPPQSVQQVAQPRQPFSNPQPTPQHHDTEQAGASPQVAFGDASTGQTHHARQSDEGASEFHTGGVDDVTHTIIEGGSFKFSTFLWIVAGLVIPLWLVSLPLCWYMAYKSYQQPATQTVRIVTQRRGN